MPAQLAGVIAFLSAVVTTVALFAAVGFALFTAWGFDAPGPALGVWVPVPGLFAVIGSVAWVGGLTALIYRGIHPGERSEFGDYWVVAGSAVAGLLGGVVLSVWVARGAGQVVSSAIAYGCAAGAAITMAWVLKRHGSGGSDLAD